MSYEIADHAGLCAGVARALKIAESLLNEESPSGLIFWGPIIHNDVVMDSYKARGAKVTECFNDLPGGCTVVFRAHGVSPDIIKSISGLGVKYADATCAHVRANQRLAREKAGEGFQIVIIGDPDHPEVIGINGWAYGAAITAKTFDELTERLETVSREGAGHGSPRRLCLIAQTTFDGDAYAEICAAVKERYPDSETHDTICAAVSERRLAARELAGRSDVMIVIGDERSSNAKQLYAMCSRINGESYFIETVGGLPPYERLRGKRIGITAGASTPDWIIEEVVEKMEEMKRLDGDIDFAEEMESSLITLQVGQTVKGRIIRYNSTEVYVDLGYKSDGVIPIEEFITDAEQDPINNIVTGEVVDVYIVRVNDSEGTVQLSKKRVDEKNNWARIEEAFESAAPIKAVVTDVTNGGLIVTSSGVRIFVPASQVSDRYVEDLRGYLRKPVELRVIDYNKQKRKFVGSMKVLIVEAKRRAAEQLWDDIDVGREYDGTVKSLTAFGAFVDIGGVDGLVHISELSWGRIKHPSDVVKVGEQISVRVISLDRDKKKISLGYRREEDNPWYRIEDKYPVGAIVTKKVVRIAPFGAFVELEKGIDALVHISQISDTRIAKPDDVLRVGMEVTAKITELNLETKKISMSIKEVEPIPYIPPIQEGEQAVIEDDELPTEHVEEMHTTLGDMLKSFGGGAGAGAVEEVVEDAVSTAGESAFEAAGAGGEPVVEAEAPNDLSGGIGEAAEIAETLETQETTETQEIPEAVETADNAETIETGIVQADGESLETPALTKDSAASEEAQEPAGSAAQAYTGETAVVADDTAVVADDKTKVADETVIVTDETPDENVAQVSTDKLIAAETRDAAEAREKNETLVSSGLPDSSVTADIIKSDETPTAAKEETITDSTSGAASEKDETI